MPEIDLERLRSLRGRAETLLGHMEEDLRAFEHEKADHGFRRTPESASDQDDVNVTTTCSCLMALAVSGKLADFYTDPKSSKSSVPAIFERLLRAPWMSSGLSENNAFTTTLVIRLHGLLAKAGIDRFADAANWEKPRWEPELRFKDFAAFAARLGKGRRLIEKHLLHLLPPPLQDDLKKFTPRANNAQSLQQRVSRELDRLIRTGTFQQFFTSTRSKLSQDAKDLWVSDLDPYKVAALNRILLHDAFRHELEPLTARSLRAIALEMAARPKVDLANSDQLRLDRFRINDYPPAAAVVYWFVDGVENSGIALDADDWGQLCDFAAAEFNRQRSLAVTKHAAMMDPVAMAMSACLCARLRALSKELKLKTTNAHHSKLPSPVELESAVVDLFSEQTTSGIWPKYFPLFHYQDAGSNFCFTFELLEAILLEFGGKQDRLLSETSVIAGLERAVDWCEKNRLPYTTTGATERPYDGWNSGGNLDTLRKGQPESWATAVVYMFLLELVESVSHCIQTRVLEKYSATKPTKSLNTLLDISLVLDSGRPGLIETLRNTIVHTFASSKGDAAQHLRRQPIEKAPLSALLFGPPGTSKTGIAKAVAAELQWPLLEIDPSHFLHDNFPNLYAQAERIFEDMMDLCGVVVLFDEMDALVQRRDPAAAPDTESKFLTTYMLPKLLKLHDRGQIAFMMATNFPGGFDEAIKRAGRFDYLLCIGPPTLEAKCDSLHKFLDLKDATDETKGAAQWIRAAAKQDPWVDGQLRLYTFDEFKSFITSIEVDEDSGASTIDKKLEALGRERFVEKVKEDSKTATLRMDDVAKLTEFANWKWLCDLDNAEVDIDEEKLAKKNKDLLKLAAVRYILERRQTRRQIIKSTVKPKDGK